MAYAGQEYGSGNVYSAGTPANVNPVKMSGNGLTTEQAAAAIVIGSLVALVLINRGFRGVSVSGVTGGIVRA